MTITTYFLADVDGTLCVAARQTDWNEPRYVVNHWPTHVRTRDFCAYFELTPDALREAVQVVRTMPGEYYCTVKGGNRFFDRQTLPLTNGGRTESILTTTEPVPVPRVGKGTTREWCDGRWYLYPLKGKSRVVEV